MKKNKPYTYKRVIAYLLDFFIVIIISSILTYFVSDNKHYEDDYNELVNITKEYQNKTITESVYLEKSNDISYKMSKDTVDITLIMCAISLGYYVLFAYFNNGVTIGKKIMHIRIVSDNGKKLKINNYLLRALFINRILCDIVLSTMILFLSKNNYLKYSNFSTFFSIFLIISLIFMMYREDGRGLHDIISNTKVIDDLNGVEEINPEKEIQEVDYEEIVDTIQIKNDTDEANEEDESKEEKKKKIKNKRKEALSESERI